MLGTCEPGYGQILYISICVDNTLLSLDVEVILENYEGSLKLAGQELRPVHDRKSKRSQIVIAVLVSATSIGFGTASAFSQTAASVNDDAAKRSSEIHWPAGFSPDDSDLFAHNEIFIKAPSSTVWQHIVAWDWFLGHLF